MSPWDEQLSDPQHCYLELVRGKYFKHGDVSYHNTDSPFRGPVRFSRLAGESMLKWAKSIGYSTARLVPCER